MSLTPATARRRPAPPTRRWFQLHLSTALVLMFGAGVLMGLNLQRRSSTYNLVQHASTPTEPDTYFTIRADTHGWPFWTDAEFTRVEADGSDFRGYTDFVESNELFKLVRAQLAIPESPTSTRALNVAIGAALLLVLALGCEGLIRRRRRKTFPAPVITGENEAAILADTSSAESSARSESDPLAR